jgi:hypothetical protein
VKHLLILASLTSFAWAINRTVELMHDATRIMEQPFTH